MGLSEDIKQKTFKNEFNKVIVNIIFTNNWIHEKQLGIFKPYGLTEPQYNVLRILRGQYPNPSTINLIIDRMLDRMSNASRIVDKLEQKGLVQRSQCRNDRRAVDVTISEKGLKLLEELDVKMTTWESQIQGINEEDAVKINELLDKFRSSKPTA